VYELLSASSG